MHSLRQPTRLFVLGALLLAAAVQQAAAQETAAYPNGTSGLKAGTVPPPGRYWLCYNRIYQADINRDAAGDIATGPGGEPLGFDVLGYANVHRFLFVTEHQILGADYAWNAVLPIVDLDVDIAAAGIHDHECRIGDLNLEPFILEWRKPRYEFGYVYGLFAPTAPRSDTNPALPGKAHWTHYIGAAGTYYFDEERTWAISFLSRYEISTRLNYKDVTPGDNFSFEWGFSKTLEETLDVGVSGYCSWQTTLDRGSDVDYPNVLDHAFALGPEIQYFSPKYKIGYALRHWWEFGVRDRTQGTITTLTFIKPF